MDVLQSDDISLQGFVDLFALLDCFNKTGPLVWRPDFAKTSMALSAIKIDRLSLYSLPVYRVFQNSTTGYGGGIICTDIFQRSGSGKPIGIDAVRIFCQRLLRSIVNKPCFIDIFYQQIAEFSKNRKKSIYPGVFGIRRVLVRYRVVGNSTFFVGYDFAGLYDVGRYFIQSKTVCCAGRSVKVLTGFDFV